MSIDFAFGETRLGTIIKFVCDIAVSLMKASKSGVLANALCDTMTCLRG